MKTTEQMLFAADYLVNGHLPDNPVELKRKLLENFGEDTVDGFEHLVPDLGFWATIKRTFGLGGMHLEGTKLKDLIKGVRDDDLRSYDTIIKKHLDLYYNDSSRKIIDGFEIDSSLDRFDNYIHDSNLTQLDLWKAVQEFSQTKFAQLHSRDLSDALTESVKEHRIPPVLSNFFELAEKNAKDSDIATSIEEMSSKIIVPLLNGIRESDGPTLQAITNYLQDNNKHEVFSEQRSSNFGEYLMMAYANQAEKNREETKSKSRMERLERGSVEGKKDERNETKETQKSTHSAGGKIPMLPKSNSGR